MVPSLSVFALVASIGMAMPVVRPHGGGASRVRAGSLAPFRRKA